MTNSKPQQIENPLLRISLKGDKIIWVVTIVLFCISILSVFSSSSSLVYQKYHGATFSVLLKHGFYLLFSFAIVYIAHNINYTFYKKYANVFFWFSIVLLIYTLLFGVQINGATRWIKIPLVNITIQSSEVAMLSLFIYLSKILSERQKEIKTLGKGFFRLLFPIVLVALLIASQKFSSSMIVIICGVIIMIIGRVNVKYVLVTTVVALSLLLSIFFYLQNMRANKPQQFENTIQTLHLERLKVLFNRIEYFQSAENESSYQRIHADMAISNGGWLGLGPGKGSLKNFLPQAYNDYIYCSIIEEYGFLGAFVIVLLYIILLHRSILLYKSCPYAFGSLLSLTLSFFISIQAIIHLAVNVGLLPVTGITLPLVSLGGTSYVLNSFGVGVILSVSRFVEKVNRRKYSEKEHQLPADLSAIILGTEKKPIL